METSLQLPGHIPYDSFLNKFWPAPADDAPILRQHPAPTKYTIRAFRDALAKAKEPKRPRYMDPTEYIVRLC